MPVQAAHYDLQRHDHRQVRDVDPVRRVRGVSHRGPRVRHVAHGGADDGKAPAPGRHRVGEGQSELSKSGSRRRQNRGRAENPQAHRRCGERTRKVSWPLPSPGREHFRLPVNQPAERQRGSVGDERRHLGNQGLIRRRHAEPRDPVLVKVERERGGQTEDDRGGARTDQPSHRTIRGAADRSAAIERDDGGAADEHGGVEDEQIVEEPQVRQREGGGRRGRQIRRRRWNRAAERFRQTPDPHRRDQRKDRRPSRRRAAPGFASRDSSRTRARRRSGTACARRNRRRRRTATSGRCATRRAATPSVVLGELSVIAQMPGGSPGRNENPA